VGSAAWCLLPNLKGNAMATVKELEALVSTLFTKVGELEASGAATAAQYVELKQYVNGVSMTVDTKYAELRASLLTLRQEMANGYVRAQTQANRTQVRVPPKSESQDDAPSYPWWLPLPEFLNWRETVQTTRENMRVQKLLSQHLHKPSGHGEGQLYIEWRKRVGVEECTAFWKSAGYDSIPEGL
jgi:hypothetical protein